MGKNIMEEDIKLKIYDYFNQMNAGDLIKSQLKKNVKNIYYKDLADNTCGWFDAKNKIIYINSNIDFNNTQLTLAHEMLHAITLRSSISAGLKRVVIENNSLVLKGRGIDEVVTQTLAEKITGIQNPNSYVVERPIFKIFTSLVNEQSYINDYLYGTNTVKPQIEKRFGNDMIGLYDKANDLLDRANESSFQGTKLDKSEPNYAEKLTSMYISASDNYKQLPEIIDKMAVIYQNVRKIEKEISEQEMIEK